MKKIIVLGAGLSGLATAYRIRQKLPNAEISILEKSDRLGGKIQSTHRDGFCFEHGPNGFMDSRQEIVDFCLELGLEKEMLRSNQDAATRFIYRNGKLHSLPNGLFGMFTMSLLSFRGKLGFLKDLFVKPHKYDDKSLAEFAEQHFGKEVRDYMMDPFSTGVFGSPCAELSLRSCFEMLFEIEQSHGSVIKGMMAKQKSAKRKRLEAGEAKKERGKLCSLKGGMAELIKTLEETLKKDCQILRNVDVKSIDKSTKRLSYSQNGEEFSVDFDALVSAIPADNFAEVFNDSFDEAAKAAAEIDYSQISVVASAYKERPSESWANAFGYLVPGIEKGSMVLGNLFSSSIYNHRAPAGSFLMRAMTGGAKAPEVIGDTEKAKALVNKDYAQTLNFKQEAQFQEVIHWSKAIPKYRPGHYQIVEKVENELKNSAVFVTGNAFYGVSMNDCIIAAEKCSQDLEKILES